jgi:uncharacterized protein
MLPCLFASDLHGRLSRYEALLSAARRERPAAIFLGGDLLPHPGAHDFAGDDFIREFLAPSFDALAHDLGQARPRIFLIMGNDDPRCEEEALLEAQGRGTWEYLHARRASLDGFDVFGYACVPPTPFSLKDWERYDVSRFVDPGAVSPEEGTRTVPVPESEVRWSTIAADLALLTGDLDLSRAILLFHAPPYRGLLDRAALDGRAVDGVPLDVHVGSVAVRRFIEERAPLLTLHGHVHESARLTGAWREQIGPTLALSAAHDGPELALVRFDPADLTRVSRDLV